MARRRLAAVLAALAAFALTLIGAAAAVPYALGALGGCFPLDGSCGDGVGWLMVFSAPITIPATLVLAIALLGLSPGHAPEDPRHRRQTGPSAYAGSTTTFVLTGVRL